MLVFLLEITLKMIDFCFVNWQFNAVYVRGKSYVFLMLPRWFADQPSLFHDCLAAFASSVIRFISLPGENAAWITVSTNINIEMATSIPPCYTCFIHIFTFTYILIKPYVSLINDPQGTQINWCMDKKITVFYRSEGDPKANDSTYA